MFCCRHLVANCTPSSPPSQPVISLTILCRCSQVITSHNIFIRPETPGTWLRLTGSDRPGHWTGLERPARADVGHPVWPTAGGFIQIRQTRYIFFGSDRSPRSHNVCLSVRLSVTKLKFIIFLAQIVKQSVSSQLEVSQWSVKSQSAVILQSVTNHIIRTMNLESYSRSLKYCVLLTK